MFPDTRTVSLTLEPQGKVFVVQATLGADLPAARFVVDTGAGTSGLSLSCARRLHLPVAEQLRVRTPTGRSAVGAIVLPAFQVGPFELRQFRLAVIPLPNDRVDGLLGLDFFRAVRAQTIALRLKPPTLDITTSLAAGAPPS